MNSYQNTYENTPPISFESSHSVRILFGFILFFFFFSFLFISFTLLEYGVSFFFFLPFLLHILSLLLLLLILFLRFRPNLLVSFHCFLTPLTKFDFSINFVIFICYVYQLLYIQYSHKKSANIFLILFDCFRWYQ